MKSLPPALRDEVVVSALQLEDGGMRADCPFNETYAVRVRVELPSIFKFLIA